MKSSKGWRSQGKTKRRLSAPQYHLLAVGACIFMGCLQEP